MSYFQLFESKLVNKYGCFDFNRSIEMIQYDEQVPKLIFTLRLAKLSRQIWKKDFKTMAKLDTKELPRLGTLSNMR